MMFFTPSSLVLCDNELVVLKEINYRRDYYVKGKK